MKEIVSKKFADAAFWHDPTTKDQSILTCMCTIKYSDNTEETLTLDLKKFNDNGTVNSDYQEAVDAITVEKINEFTISRAERKEREKKHSLIIEEQKKLSKNLEELFNLKLKAFNIDEIKNCDDKYLRSKIRKSRNEVELNAWATIIMMRSLDHDNENT